MKSLARPQLDALLETAKKESSLDWLMFLVTFYLGHKNGANTMIYMAADIQEAAAAFAQAVGQ